MGAIRLNRRAMEWGFPWTAAIHPMVIDQNGDVTALCRACPQCGRCPGLGNCRARLILADGGKCGCFTAPGGWQQHTPPIADYPLAGLAHPGRPPSARQASTTLLFNPALPSAGETEGRVLCSWRLYEIEARFWRAPPGGCVAASRAESIRTVWSCLTGR